MFILNDTNKIVFKDSLSHTKLSISYRMPTTDEVISYIHEKYSNPNLTIRDISLLQMKYAKNLLTGIGKANFGIVVDDKIIPLSSDKKDPDYREDWKGLLCDYYPQLILLFANHVLEPNIQVIEKN